MKIIPGGNTAAVTPALVDTTAPKPPEVPLGVAGLEQLETFVASIHTAVDAQTADLKKKGKTVPDTLAEKAHAADQLLAAAKDGRSLSAAEVATQLNALLWELNPAQLTALRDGLSSTAKDFGELAKLQKRPLPGMPATLGSVVELLSGASKVPVSLEEVERMLGDVRTSLEKNAGNPELVEQLQAQRGQLLGFKRRLELGEAIVRPLSLPTTQAGAQKAIIRLVESLGDVQTQLAALLGDKNPAQLQGSAKKSFAALAEKAVAMGNDLQTLEQYSAQLQGYAEPTMLDKSAVLVGVSLGPQFDLAKWIPGFPIPVFGGVGAGLHLFEKDKHTGARKLDWYGAANLQTPFGGGGYAISPSKKGFSAAFNPPLGSKVGISLATHPFHGRKLDVFMPGVFRAEATSTGALALTLFAPVPIPILKVGVTVLVRNPVLANITGPILWAMDKVAGVAKKAVQTGKELAVSGWTAITGKDAKPAAVAPNPA